LATEERGKIKSAAEAAKIFPIESVFTTEIYSAATGIVS